MADDDRHPVNWNTVFAVAAGATQGAATTYAATQATTAASQVAATNWPLILGLGVGVLGIALYLKKK